MSRRILFYRDLRNFSGGHLKVYHYFQHLLQSERYTPRIAFGPDTVWDEFNPWSGQREQVVDWDPERTDLVFLAGKDWEYALAHGLEASGRPVVNLVQHLRHADPEQPLRRYLGRRALRICVSAEVAEAIGGTGEVNGPVITIPNGIEVAPLPDDFASATPPGSAGREPVLILATKQTDFARAVDDGLRREGVTTRLHDRFIPRKEFLARLGRHALVVCIPDPEEGFYLPALEAMERGAFVVCPDCIGNRSFCLDGVTGYRPAHDVAAIVAATLRARELPDTAFAAMRLRGRERAEDHSLAGEAERFLAALDEFVETNHG